MLKTALRLTLENVAVFIFATFIIFWIINQAPGNPVDIWHPEPGLSAEERALIAQELGLDQPLPIRYSKLLWRTLTLDLGSFEGIPIRQWIVHGTGVTLALALGAVLVSILVGVPLGVLLGMERGGWSARIGGWLFYVISLVPVFLLCYLVHLFFLGTFGILPTFDAVEHREPIWKIVTGVSMVAVLGIGDGTVTEILRYVRAEVHRISGSTFLRAIRANGGSVAKHLAKNVLVPIATVVNLRMLYFLGGAVVVEAIFQMSGLGWLTWQSIDNRNFELLFAVSVVSVIAVCIVNLLNTLLVGYVDPRTRAA